jgi:thiosulfate/3-mercaptopyruvate sulfurtransferase
MEKVMLRDPDALVSGDWLEQHMGDESLLIFDCSTVLEFNTGETPYRVVNCRAEYEQEHIPGSGYFDLQADFSRAESPFKMTLAEPEKVASAFERMGVGDGSRVVLYSRRSMAWAARFWWMLHWLGFDRASLLDGGFERWQGDGRPVSLGKNAYPPGHLTLKVRPDLFVGKEQVLAAIDDPATCIVNALGPDVYSGANARYGRPGRVPGSVNVPKVSLVDPETHKFKPPDEIARLFSSVGADKASRQIAYCGGGIFATVDAFWLHQLGHENIAVYDNSMSEWATDTSLPIERD